MKKTIAYFLLAFVLAFMAGRGWNYLRTSSSPAPGLSARLIDCDPNQVRGLRLLRKDGSTLEFHRLDPYRPNIPSPALLASARWRMAGAPEQEADASVLSRLASMACDLYNPAPAEGMALGESAGGAKGLELVVQKDGVSTVHALDFGALSANRQALVRYRAPDGGAAQLHVTPKLLQLASLDPKEYRNLKVLSLNGDQVMALLVADQKKERFTLERDGAGWSVHHSGKKIADGGEAANQYVNRLGTLRALDAKPAPGVKCEELPFKLKIALSGVGGRSEELFLDYGKAGSLRACDTSRESLFEVHRDLLRYVDVPAKALAR